MLANTPNQSAKFRTTKWVQINDDAHGTYNTNSEINKTLILKSSSCDYSDGYILVSETIIVKNTGRTANPNNRKNVITKNCAPFTDCISEINNAQIDNAKDIDIVMAMYNLIEYSDNYSKTSASLWQYYRDESFLNANGAIADFSSDDDNSALFKFRRKIAGRTRNNGRKHVKIRVPLEHLSNVCRTLEISIINCENNLILT